MVRTTSWISRRTALRGAGAVVSLPWLEAMGPRMAWAEGGTAETAAPNRMAFLYVPNGINMTDWTPQQEGDRKSTRLNSSH